MEPLGESATNTQEDSIENKPVFDGGNFTIEFLPESPKGLSITTRNSLLRHEPNTKLPEATRIRKQRDIEPKKFRVGPGFSPKVGVRNIEKQGDNLTLDIKPITFPTYKEIFSIDEREALDVSNPSATAGILFTTETDGSHKLILQHRSENNYPFGDVPGASVAGYLDGHLDPNNRGRLIPIDTDTIEGNLEKELDEELGIHVADVDDIRITALAKDKTRIHDEFLLFGISNLNAEQVAQKVINRKREKRPNDHFDFEGNYFVIDGTPEAISTLLTQVKCPLPPTHTAAFVAAGYNLIIERGGLDAAKEWLNVIETGIKLNYQEIDKIVRKYWMSNTDKAVVKPDDRPERNLNGYDPSYIPSEQGLPDVKSELIRTRLIEIPKNSELTKEPQNAWLFDVDGVLTNPQEKRIKEPEILEEIITRLKKGEPIGLNTGRSIDFVVEQVLTPLENKVDDKNLLDSIIAIGEKGGVWITYENGKRIEHVDEQIKVPLELKDRIRTLTESEFNETMFFDETKKTMITVEMNHNEKLERFHEIQKELVLKLQKLIEEMELKGIKIDPTQIATDIENSHVGKALGAKRFLEILSGREISPKHITAFGDSASDLEMISPLKDSGISTKFIFVGTQGPQDSEHIITTESHFDKGALDYLKNN